MTKIAIAGVMGNVGREILNFFEEDGVSASNIIALEPKAPLGTMVSYGEDEDLDVKNLDDFDFAKTDIIIFATSEEMTKKYLPLAKAKNIKIVDCSGATFTDANVPMVVYGVNNESVLQSKNNIVAIPSAFVTQILQPLAKINQELNLIRLTISAYISTSVYGREAMDELFNQTRKIFMNSTLIDDETIFKKQIAFNVLPQVGEFIGDETKTEWEINAQIKKVLGGNMKIHANCAFVPAFIGSGMFINAECLNEVDADNVRQIMQQTNGVIVFDKQVDGGYVSLTDVQGEDNVYVSRIRQDLSVENGFSFWAVADNLRAGTAKNAFNVAKLLLQK